MTLPHPVSLFMDILIFGLGTYGAIILVSEFVELDRIPTPRQAAQIFRTHWKASLALLAANLLFLLRLYLGLAR